MNNIDTEKLKTASFIAGHQELYQCIINGEQHRSDEIRMRISVYPWALDNAKQFCRRLRSQANQFGLVATWFDQGQQRHISIRKPSYSYKPQTQ
tara:strand:+ start:827 stop:1108 length:282 start_codon:yes stop_codon:yes gene_type:complete